MKIRCSQRHSESGKKLSAFLFWIPGLMKELHDKWVAANRLNCLIIYKGIKKFCLRLIAILLFKNTANKSKTKIITF